MIGRKAIIMEMSPELKAMAAIELALKDLADDERTRVFNWVAGRFGVNLRKQSEKAGSDSTVTNRNDSAAADAITDVAEFYDSANPKTDAEKSLVVAYWLQYKDGQTDVDSQSINSALKHMGYGVGNITRALENLKDQKPALIVQTRKDGTTKQARKRFKVTTEGKKQVERMLSGGTDD